MTEPTQAGNAQPEPQPAAPAQPPHPADPLAPDGAPTETVARPDATPVADPELAAMVRADTADTADTVVMTDVTPPPAPVAPPPEAPAAQAPAPVVAVPIVAAPVVAAPVAAAPRRSPLGTLMRIVTFLFGLLQALLIIRIVLLLLNANQDDQIVSSIMSLTQPFVDPFLGMFNLDSVSGKSGAALDIAAIVALIAWTLVETLILSVLRLFDRRAR